LLQIIYTRKTKSHQVGRPIQPFHEPAQPLTHQDDFKNHHANNTNLAIKGIVVLNAFAEIASAIGDNATATKYMSIATSYYTAWAKEAIDPSHTHAILAYQWNNSYSILYNTYPALLLNLSIILESLYAMQSAFYPTLAQKYGDPLDNRQLWTKSDWRCGQLLPVLQKR
jgi:hypothetical protein